MTNAVALEKASEHIGETLFTSQWINVDREHLAQFGWSTYLDPDYTDLTVSKNNPLGPDLIDGFLLLSLLTSIHFNHNPITAGETLYGLNYGLDRVRFTAPVFVGQRLRLVCTIEEVQDKGAGQLLITTSNTLEVEGQNKPAMVATWLSLFIPGEQ
ncbi:MaoC/PaaZ C-terminal domain-containing protein [Speluncibacter jeojiensis]|uniref:MaoC/PaaZ C-terminal domain-containing protein n=1 Tax=Speluncibacter jeojiensis TaxID=2710754 RepID=A0A9X4RCM3_9ACTN|nr:MaoC/PaaZ C-terminal domain-containing protein [Corynebacteriales bacterium D3-21]